jgi:hypothetical protein
MKPTYSNQRPLPGMPSRSGIGFLVFVCFFSCVFLIVNSMLIQYYLPHVTWIFERMANWLIKPSARALYGQRLLQISVFALPVVLLFAEWALLDWIVDLISVLEKPANRPDSQKDRD